jgi:hypothetical protein
LQRLVAHGLDAPAAHDQLARHSALVLRPQQVVDLGEERQPTVRRVDVARPPCVDPRDVRGAVGRDPISSRPP